MQPIVTNRVEWSVGRSVTVLNPAKIYLTDQDAVWIVDSGRPKEACVTWWAHWRHLVNTTEPSVCGSDAALCHITLTTYY